MKKFLVFLTALNIILLVVAVVLTVNKYNSEEVVSESVYTENIVDDKNDIVTISVTAVGDCTLGTDVNSGLAYTFDNEVKTQNNDYSYFLRNVKPFFEKDDLTIVNFEGTLSSGGQRADKQYAFRGKPEYAKILSCASVEAANLANNHTGDYGYQALVDSFDILSSNNIVPFGMNTVEIKEINGKIVGLIGTNALSYEGIKNFYINLDKLKQQNPDLIIASFHWGKEASTTPDGNQIQLAHQAIDNGVDLVIGHHPHVIQGIEKYKGKYIVYSLGNFCFGGNTNPSDKDTMIFNQIFTFEGKNLIIDDNVTVLPCSVSSVTERNNFQPTPLKHKEFERVKNKIVTRSKSFEVIENVTCIEG